MDIAIFWERKKNVLDIGIDIGNQNSEKTGEYMYEMGLKAFILDLIHVEVFDKMALTVLLF